MVFFPRFKRTKKRDASPAFFFSSSLDRNLLKHRIDSAHLAPVVCLDPLTMRRHPSPALFAPNPALPDPCTTALPSTETSPREQVEVPALRVLVEEASGVAASRQRLIFRGRVLKDTQRISELRIGDGDTLLMVERPPDVPGNPINDDPALQQQQQPRGPQGMHFGTISVPASVMGQQQIGQIMSSLMGLAGTAGGSPDDIAAAAAAAAGITPDLLASLPEGGEMGFEVSFGSNGGPPRVTRRGRIGVGAGGGAPGGATRPSYDTVDVVTAHTNAVRRLTADLTRDAAGLTHGGGSTGSTTLSARDPAEDPASPSAREESPPPHPPSGQSEPEPSGRRVTHAGVQCDGCSVQPIRGARYKSVTNADYDLCEACHNARVGVTPAVVPFTRLDHQLPVFVPPPVIAPPNLTPARQEQRPQPEEGADAPRTQPTVRRSPTDSPAPTSAQAAAQAAEVAQAISRNVVMGARAAASQAAEVTPPGAPTDRGAPSAYAARDAAADVTAAARAARAAAEARDVAAAEAARTAATIGRPLVRPPLPRLPSLLTASNVADMLEGAAGAMRGVESVLVSTVATLRDLRREDDGAEGASGSAGGGAAGEGERGRSVGSGRDRDRARRETAQGELLRTSMALHSAGSLLMELARVSGSVHVNGAAQRMPPFLASAFRAAADDADVTAPIEGQNEREEAARGADAGVTRFLAPSLMYLDPQGGTSPVSGVPTAMRMAAMSPTPGVGRTGGTDSLSGGGGNSAFPWPAPPGVSPRTDPGAPPGIDPMSILNEILNIASGPGSAATEGTTRGTEAVPGAGDDISGSGGLGETGEATTTSLGGVTGGVGTHAGATAPEAPSVTQTTEENQREETQRPQIQRERLSEELLLQQREIARAARSLGMADVAAIFERHLETQQPEPPQQSEPPRPEVEATGVERSDPLSGGFQRPQPSNPPAPDPAAEATSAASPAATSASPALSTTDSDPTPDPTPGGQSDAPRRSRPRGPGAPAAAAVNALGGLFNMFRGIGASARQQPPQSQPPPQPSQPQPSQPQPPQAQPSQPQPPPRAQPQQPSGGGGDDDGGRARTSAAPPRSTFRFEFNANAHPRAATTARGAAQGAAQGGDGDAGSAPREEPRRPTASFTTSFTGPDGVTTTRSASAGGNANGGGISQSTTVDPNGRVTHRIQFQMNGSAGSGQPQPQPQPQTSASARRTPSPAATGGGAAAGAPAEIGQQTFFPFRADGANAPEALQHIMSSIIGNLQQGGTAPAGGTARLQLVPIPGGGFRLVSEGTGASAPAAPTPATTTTGGPHAGPPASTAPVGEAPGVSRSSAPSPAAPPSDRPAGPRVAWGEEAATAPAAGIEPGAVTMAGESASFDGAHGGGIGLGAHLPPRPAARRSRGRRTAPRGPHPQADLD